jgi:hypothetical protein
MSDKKSPPVAKVSVGTISAAIWRNESQGRTFYSTTFESRYKDDQGNWQTSDSYNQMDLLALAKCADLAFNEIAALRKQDKEADAAKAA